MGLSQYLAQRYPMIHPVMVCVDFRADHKHINEWAECLVGNLKNCNNSNNNNLYWLHVWDHVWYGPCEHFQNCHFDFHWIYINYYFTKIYFQVSWNLKNHRSQVDTGLVKWCWLMVPIDYFFLNVLKETQTHPSSFACVIEVLLAMDAFPKQRSERSSSVWEVSQF